MEKAKSVALGALKTYLKETFGDTKAIPEVMLEGMALAIAEDRGEFAEVVLEENVHEMIRDIEYNKQIELSDEEEGEVYDRFIHNFVSANETYQMVYEIIDNILNEREETNHV